jgi:hypothetical protein
LSLGGSSPYTSTDKTNKNKYTQTNNKKTKYKQLRPESLYYYYIMKITIFFTEIVCRVLEFFLFRICTHIVRGTSQRIYIYISLIIKFYLNIQSTGYNAVSLGGSRCFEEMYSCHLQGSIVQSLICLTLEDESATFLPNAETDHTTTRRHIPEDLNPPVQRFQDSQTLLYYLWSLQGSNTSLYSASSVN